MEQETNEIAIATYKIYFNRGKRKIWVKAQDGREYTFVVVEKSASVPQSA